MPIFLNSFHLSENWIHLWHYLVSIYSEMRSIKSTDVWKINFVCSCPFCYYRPIYIWIRIVKVKFWYHEWLSQSIVCGNLAAKRILWYLGRLNDLFFWYIDVCSRDCFKISLIFLILFAILKMERKWLM